LARILYRVVSAGLARLGPQPAKEPAIMKTIFRFVLLVAALGVAYFGCDRGEVREEVQEMKEAKRKLSREVKAHYEDAKDEAQKLKEQLPAADEVKSELVEAGAEAKEVLLRVGERMKQQAIDLKDELKDAVRERIADAD
jgi:hypothetical protein